jgi:hypothetical protein
MAQLVNRNLLVENDRAKIIELIRKTRDYISYYLIFTSDANYYEALTKELPKEQIYVNTIMPLSDVAVNKIVERQAMMTQGYNIANSIDVLRAVYNGSLKYRKIKKNPQIEEIVKCLTEWIGTIDADEELLPEEKEIRREFAVKTADEKLMPLFRAHIIEHRKLLKRIKIDLDTDAYEDLDDVETNEVADEEKDAVSKSKKKREKRKAKGKTKKEKKKMTERPECRVAIEYVDVNPNLMLIVDNKVQTEKLDAILANSKKLMTTFVLFTAEPTDVPLGVGGYFEKYDPEFLELDTATSSE